MGVFQMSILLKIHYVCPSKQKFSLLGLTLNGLGSRNYWQPFVDVLSCSIGFLTEEREIFVCQLFLSRMNGNARCSGHTECDAILMDQATVSAIPEVTAAHVDAALIHEAAIGKIAGEQLIKLMSLGLTEAEAEEQIVSGFLK